MSQDIRRYELLQRVVDGKLTLCEITEALGAGYRQAKRLKAKVAAAVVLSRSPSS